MVDVCFDVCKKAAAIEHVTIQQLCMTLMSMSVQLREKAAAAKEEAGGLAPLAHGALEAQKEEQRRASELAALKK